MIDGVTASIVIAIIGGLCAVWAAWVSNKSDKRTRDITAVLNNTKTPVDSLDQVVRLLQEELNRTNQRHDTERKYFEGEIVRIRREHKLDREEWEASEFKMQAEIEKLVRERGDLLHQIEELKDKLASIEIQVRESLSNVKGLDKK